MGTSNYSDEFKRDAVQQISMRRLHPIDFVRFKRVPQASEGAV